MKKLLFCMILFFVCACEPKKIALTIPLEDGCLGIGFSEEVECTGRPRCELSEGPTLYWDGRVGLWTVIRCNGKDYQTFLLRFCTDNTNENNYLKFYLPLEPGVKTPDLEFQNDIDLEPPVIMELHIEPGHRY